MFHCTDWRSVHSVECGVSGVQLDGGQHGLTAGGGSDSGGSSVGERSSNGGSGVVEGETGGVGVGDASDSRSSDHSGGGLLISGPLAVPESGVGVGDDGGGVDLMGDLSGGDHIRLDDRSVGNSADRGEGGDGGGKSSAVGETSIGESTIDKDLGIGLSRPLAISEGNGVGVGDNGSSSDLMGDLSGGDHIRLDDNRLCNSADRSEGGYGGGKSSGVGETSIGESSTIDKDLGIGLSLLPLSGSGGGSIESSLEFSLGSGHLSGVLNRGGALKVEHGGGKGSDLWGSRGGGSHREVGGSDSVAVHGVGHIVNCLEEAVGVNILVTAGGHAIRIP